MIYVVYFSDAGAPASGLTPTITVFKKVADGSDVVPPSVSEIGGGFYKFAATAGEPIVVQVDGGVGLADADRYKVMQITAHDGDLDTSISGVQSALGLVMVDLLDKLDSVMAKTDNLPADPADQSAVEAAVTAAVAPLALQTSVDDLKGRLTVDRAGKLDNLDAAISSRSTLTQAQAEAACDAALANL